MHRWSERPMTADEQLRLLQCMPLVPSPFKPFRNYQYRLNYIAEAFGVVLALAIIVGFGHGDIHTAVAIPTAIGFLALWWLLHLKSRVLNPLYAWRKANAKIWKIHEAVSATKTVRVCSVETDAVVQVMCDEGMICLFEVGEHQTFWVDPSCMIPCKPPPKWPNHKFEIIRIPGVTEEVGPFCLGKALRAKQTVEFRDLFDQNGYEPPADGLINQRLDEILRTGFEKRDRQI
jgi:hypothetical protein